jgi:rubrerythrin
MSNPRKPTDVRSNRTGIGTSPVESKQAIEGARKATDRPRVDGKELLATRVKLSRQAEPVGTMPPPSSLKSVAKAAVDIVKGKHPMVFLDLLAERLAFERTGTRLYDALLAKHAAADPQPEGPTRAELEQIRDEELRHFALLKDAIEKLGGDPTVMTPSADITAVLSMGLVQTLAEPRVTFTQALKAILVAELTDNDGWRSLADVAEHLGHDEMAQRFQLALAEEDEHLELVRSWVTSAIEGQVGVTSADAASIGTETGDERRDDR